MLRARPAREVVVGRDRIQYGSLFGFSTLNLWIWFAMKWGLVARAGELVEVSI